MCLNKFLFQENIQTYVSGGGGHRVFKSRLLLTTKTNVNMVSFLLFFPPQ